MIFGQEIGLRPVEERDLERLARWRNMPEIHGGFFSPFYFSLAAQKRWYGELVASTTRMMFMAVRLSDGKAIGTGGLDNIDWRNKSAEYGSVLVDPAERGHRYAVDIGGTLINYAFDELNMHRVYARILAQNKAALKTVIEGHGLKVEGMARKAFFAGGRFQDVVLLGLLREEWQGYRADAHR